MILDICEYCQLKSPATKALKHSQLQKLGKSCVEVTFQKGDIIFKQGALSSNIIYIKEGLVKIHITGPTNEQIIKVAKAPTYLGIPTTFGEKTNQYSATAIENTTVCFIDINTFKNFIHENGEFAYEIVIELCRNEVNSFTKCVNRTQKNIPGRLADALLFFQNNIYQKTEFIVPLSRSELGNLVDTSRESVSRILSEFHTDSIIEITGKKIKILNESFLETISKNG